MSSTIGLQLPQTCTVLDNEEMSYIDGGAVMTVRMYRGLWSWSGASREAAGIKRAAGSQLSNLSLGDLQLELYAHACVYYDWTALKDSSIQFLSSIYSSAANGIQIDNGRDSRHAAFGLIYAFSRFQP